MKKVLVLFGSCIFSLAMYAQSTNDYIELTRDILKTEKKAAIAEVMQLTDAESQPFWNLYNEYQSEIYTQYNTLIAIIKDYATNFDNLSDVKADELWTRTLEHKQNLLKLQKSYYAKFKKVLPLGKTAKYFQAENKIEAMVNASLALQIPLLETE
jgi:hemoglobin-like flavoprotein